ncbi:MAG: response regulator [Ignavibacteriaceae bacterium]|nr:response regulator [Ignavibacteriaceae bacterium]
MAKILIIENSIFMKGSLKYLLEQAKHNIVGVAKNQEEALRMFEQYHPDITTCDLLMRGEDGMPIIRALLAKHPDNKIVAVWVSGLETKIEEAKQAGVAGILEKPYKFEELTKEIERVLNARSI